MYPPQLISTTSYPVPTLLQEDCLGKPITRPIVTPKMAAIVSILANQDGERVTEEWLQKWPSFATSVAILLQCLIYVFAVNVE